MRFDISKPADVAAAEQKLRETRKLDGDINARFLGVPPMLVRSMAADFDAADSSARALIANLLYPGLTLFHAPPKRGKTFLAVRIARGVITGEAFADAFEVNQCGPVLYLSEMSEAQLRRRTKASGMNRANHKML